MLNQLTSSIPNCVCAADNKNGTYRLDMIDGTSRLATGAEITNAQALFDQAATEQTQLQTDKAAMKTAYTTAVTRLQAISTATFSNNGQRDVAIQDLAKYLLALAKVAKGLL